MTFDGAEVADEQEFLVATNSYRARGGGFSLMPKDTVVFTNTHQFLFDLAEFFGDGRQKAARPLKCPWRFSDLRRTRAVFQTSTKARQHLAEIVDFDPIDLGDNADGFANIEIGF